MTPGRHVPLRTCMGCGERAPQPQLLCVCTAADGCLQIVARRGRAGRSGYLHRRRQCWDQFAARKGPLRSLRRSVDRPMRRAFVDRLKTVEPSALTR